MACAASPISWMRPRPQFCVSGRVNRPHFEHSVTRLKSFSRRGSGVGKVKRRASGSAGIATARPAFLHPFVRVLLGDDVPELLAADVIGEEMATRPDPLDMARRREHLLRQILAVRERTPYHLTRIGGGVLAIERPADDRAHAIGADHDLRLDLSAIGESENDTVASLLQSCQAMSQMNGAMIEPACECVQEVGVVKGIIGSAVPRCSLVPI